MRYPEVDFRKQVDGQWYWCLVARNGKVTGRGEAHPSRWMAVRAWRTHQQIARGAVIERSR